MEQKQEIILSVRNLVELVLRAGNLDSRFMGSSRAVEGTKAHQKLQKSYKENYIPEVALKHTLQYEEIILTLQGRADGIFLEADGPVIDEIKTTMRPLEELDGENLLHWAQAKCYGYIYSMQNQLDEISVQLTYYQLDTEEIKRFRKAFHIQELEVFLYELLKGYISWANWTRSWEIKRNQSIQQMEFPFGQYRKGQRNLAVAVYKSIKEGKQLFAQAPTGTGKTISTLFPTVKALGERYASKIFYLTAKTITRSVAEEAFERMQKKGLDCKTLTLTAKEKICFEKGAKCVPEECSYAKGHFDRVNAAIEDILKNENALTREIIEIYGQKHRVCPFEFSLDLALWADCVICDYNYVFDPRVYLKRFFQEQNEDYIFLIDEAHNLVDRSREMFSAALNKKEILHLKKMMKEKEPKLFKSLNQLNAYMIQMRKQWEEKGILVMTEEPKEIYPMLRKFMTQADEWLQKNEKTSGYEELLDFYFEAAAFLRIAELYDERYVTYVEKEVGDLKLKLFCLDPSKLLKEALARGKAAVLFSATLSPMDYFVEILGGDEATRKLLLPSPFEREKLCLMIAGDVSTKYRDREKSYTSIAQYIYETVCGKKGNYMVYFPSYKYMQEVAAIFQEQYPHMTVIVQQNGMSEEERKAFLENFQPGRSDALIGFAVMGGIFSEGVDLTGERLIGAIIVGVGLPQICLETDIIREYFQKKNQQGFEFAYMYPGMNKVLQAAGRVIRTEEDQGVILLIDERFTTSRYQQIFPMEWRNCLRIKALARLKKALEEFWPEKTV
ncbi:ATP-dependent DNA helicase [Geosporobacter ferrireducens]|uniref:ATP-dependent helicase n=1 Tax=Geosporobacter ferrireducens TaxID=1424294 RepID=A0A1D8GJL4_9FIRM|nr:ATP-dependent DNA helicase [Geosporobacter ferrireducens]AOT71105.1 ATP-dependent helicase [Geosporobacter ferrireducens]MTI57910.1 ATP-dependent DNA helicase [Geosporobacter ferrireducens]